MSYSNGNNHNDEESQLKKLFIGGLNIETTVESLRSFYSKWGELIDCVVMKDANTGRSKCYGFITFSDAEFLDKCMLERPHVIDGKQVDPKRAMPKEAKNSQNLDMHQPVKKVFIGGLKDLVENEIREYFSKFGNVVAFDMVTDKATGKNRGFCFLTYDDTDSVDKIVLLKYHTLRDIRVEVKKAVERDNRRGVGGPGRGGMGPARQGMHSNNGPMSHPGNYRGHYGMPDMQQGYSQWNMNAPQMWNQGYQGVESSAGYSLGAGYGGNNVGGAMRGNRHTQRAPAPYKHSNAHASYGAAPYGNTNAAAPYANNGPRGSAPYHYDSNAVGPGYGQS